MDWPRIKAAVAKVVAGNGEQRVTGTAFFIGGSYALTALHVVADTESDAPRFLTPITLTFEGGITTGAIVSNGLWDVNADWAVLECASPPMVTPLEMRADAPQDADWKAFGYPASESAGEVREGETVADNQELARLTPGRFSCFARKRPPALVPGSTASRARHAWWTDRSSDCFAPR